ncbi:hypothetical protein D3C85_1209410 [compost metagenome]
MRRKLRAERCHQVWRPVGGIHQAIVEKTQNRVGAVQRVPASALLQPFAQGDLLFQAGDDLAGVGQQKVSGAQSVQVRVVLEHPHADALVLAEQLEQLQAGEIDVVVFSSRYHDTINSACLFIFYTVALLHD